jgi:hypothetical protein
LLLGFNHIQFPAIKALQLLLNFLRQICLPSVLTKYYIVNSSFVSRVRPKPVPCLQRVWISNAICSMYYIRTSIYSWKKSRHDNLLNIDALMLVKCFNSFKTEFHGNSISSKSKRICISFSLNTKYLVHEALVFFYSHSMLFF